MIERIVLLKLADEYANDDGYRHIAKETLRVFPTIPGVVGVHVSQAAEEGSRGSWDLCLRVVFRSVDDIEPYREHPIHLAYLRDVLKERLTFIKAWNFESMDSRGSL